MADRREAGHFGVVVLVGLATSGLTAVAAARDWFTTPVLRDAALGLSDAGNTADMPLALAAALVVLAAWGVVLVTGTGARRVVLAVAALAAVGVLACVVRAPSLLPDQIAERLGRPVETDPTGWYVVTCVALLPALAAVLVGWCWLRGGPP